MAPSPSSSSGPYSPAAPSVASSTTCACRSITWGTPPGTDPSSHARSRDRASADRRDRGDHRQRARHRSRPAPGRPGDPGRVGRPGRVDPAARSWPMQACMPSPKLRPHLATPSGTPGAGRTLGIVAERRRVPVGRHQVDRESGTTGHDHATGQLHVLQRPAHGDRARGLEPHRLVHAPLQEHRIGAGALEVVRSVAADLEDVVQGSTNAVALVCAPASRKKQISRSTTSGASGSSSSWRMSVVNTSWGSASSSSSPRSTSSSSERRRSIDGARNSTSKSARASATSARLARPVTGVVRQRGALDEQHQVVVELQGLVPGPGGAIDTGGERGQVHHHLVAERDQLRMSCCDVRGQRGIHDRGNSSRS